MAKSIPAIKPAEITYKGQFNFEMLYKNLYYWFDKFGFKDDPTGDGKPEHLYFDKTDANGSKEKWIWWRLQKKESEYFTYKFKLELHVLGMTKSEALIEGKKIKSNTMEISIFFSSEVVIEEELDFSKNWITNTFQAHFQNRIQKTLIDEKKTHLYNLSHDLINNIKQFLGLMLDTPQPKRFHDAFGVPQLK